MGEVIAAQDRAQPGCVVLRLEAGDLALDQRVRGPAGRRHLDGDRRADVDVELGDDVAGWIVEGDREHSWQVLVMIDHNLLEKSFHGIWEWRSIDLDIGPEMILLRHFSSC